MNIKNFKIGFIIMTILIILNLIIFTFYFHNNNISENLSDWANFATYIGGITNIFISIMTLLVTIFIAYEISKIDEKRNKANIEYDKKRFKRELMEKEYADISENLNNFWFAITNSNRKQSKDELMVIRTKFVNFIKYKKHLFPEFNTEQFQNLDDILIECLKKSSENLETDNPRMIELVGEFQREVSIFHKKTQEYIVSE